MTISWMLRIVLFPLTIPYLAAVAINRFLYYSRIKSRYRLSGVTISVGNIEAGGTGKSPIVIELAKYLLELGHRPAILTRGYRSGLKGGEYLEVVSGNILRRHKATGAVFPDEALMQSHMLPGVPVIVGADRQAAARWFLANASISPTHWILDDGFQHWPLHRDVEIVLLDAQKPFGNRLCLPLGRLRELPFALRRADCVLLTRSQSVNPDSETVREIRKYYSGHLAAAFFSTAFPAPVSAGVHLDLRSSSNSLLLAAGIARPAELIANLATLGLCFSATYIVPDHERFEQGILNLKCRGVTAIVTTAKDYWRDPQAFASLPIPTFIAELTVEPLVDEFSKILSLQ